MRLQKYLARPFARLPLSPSLAAVAFLLCFYVYGPSPPTNEVFAGVTMDKLIHATAFAGITLCLYLFTNLGINHFTKATALMAACAVGFELLQGFSLGRQNSAADATANVLGVLIAFLVSWTTRRRERMAAPARPGLSVENDN